jgi:hypothetical protein
VYISNPHRTIEMLPRLTDTIYTGRLVTTGSFERSFYHSPPPSPPKLGKPSSNSQKALRFPTPESNLKAAPPLVDQSKTVSLQNPAHHAATSLPTPRSSLDKSQHLFSPVTDPAVVTLQPSAEKIETLSFEQVVLRLKPLLDRTTGEREISLDGVSPDIVDKLRASELPGWEILRYVID